MPLRGLRVLDLPDAVRDPVDDEVPGPVAPERAGDLIGRGPDGVRCVAGGGGVTVTWTVPEALDCPSSASASRRSRPPRKTGGAHGSVGRAEGDAARTVLLAPADGGEGLGLPSSFTFPRVVWPGSPRRGPRRLDGWREVRGAPASYTLHSRMPVDARPSASNSSGAGRCEFRKRRAVELISARPNPVALVTVTNAEPSQYCNRQALGSRTPPRSSNHRRPSRGS